jgi:uncharacterized protein (DUF58 family)
MPGHSNQLFDEATLRQFESAGLLARRLVRGRLRAERRSFTRGMSVEFAEYRPFVSGDDWRAIDWNAYARWRQLVLKLFVEEEDLHVHFLLDCSASMGWGTPGKFDQARRIVAGLAYLSLANLDRAAFVPLGVSASRGLAPRRGRERFPEWLGALSACPADGGSVCLEDSVRLWLRGAPRKGLVVMVGDLFGSGLGDARAAIDRIRHAGQEVAVIQIVDPAELAPPAPGEYEFEDCETGNVRRVVLDPAGAMRFSERVHKFLEAMESHTKKHGMPFLRVENQTPLSEIFSAVLAWQ